MIKTEQSGNVWYAWVEEDGVCVGSGETKDAAKRDLQAALSLHRAEAQRVAATTDK